MKRRVRKVVRWTLGILIGLECAYLLAANLFLAFGVHLLFAGTSSVNATFRHAWTLWPGRVHLRDLRLIFQDHNLQWSLDLRRVEVDIRLDQLVRRTFHATRVRADGVAFHMRHRIEPESAHAPWVGALPSMREFPGPALFEAYVPEAPVADADYKLWTIHLEDVDVALDDVWVQAFHYLGPGRARGRFFLRPARWLWVGPASLELEPGTLTVSAYQVAQHLRARINCEVEPFDVRLPSGMGVFRFISSHIQLNADDVSPEFASLFGPSALRDVSAASGELALDVRVRKGTIEPGSQLTLSERDLNLRIRGAELGAQQIALHALALEQGLSSVRISLTSALVNRPLASGPAPRVELAELVLDGENLDTTQDFSMRELRLERALLELPDARWLNDLLRAEKLELRGKATLTASARYRDATHSSGELALRLGDDAALVRSTGDARLLLPGATLNAKVIESPLEREASWNLRAPGFTGSSGATLVRSGLTARGSARETRSNGALRFSAQGNFDASLTRLGPGTTVHVARAPFELELLTNARSAARSGSLRARLDTASLSVDQNQDGQSCSWLSAAESRIALSARFEPRGPALELTARAAKARVKWGDFAAGGDLALMANVEPGLLGGRGKAAGSLALREAHVSSGKGDGKGWEARVPALILGYAADARPGKLGLKLELAASAAKGRIGASALAADLEARIALASVDLSGRAAHGVADLRIAHASLASGQEHVSDWWGNVRLDALAASAQRDLDFNSGFSASLKDASPALAVLTAQGSLPSWVQQLFPLRDLTASGNVSRRCQLTDFRLERASGGPLFSRGRLESTSDGFHGAALLRLSAFQLISAGLGFDSEHVSVSPLVGEGWLADRNAELDERAASCAAPPEDTRRACGD